MSASVRMTFALYLLFQAFLVLLYNVPVSNSGALWECDSALTTLPCVNYFLPNFPTGMTCWLFYCFLFNYCFDLHLLFYHNHSQNSFQHKKHQWHLPEWLVASICYLNSPMSADIIHPTVMVKREKVIHQIRRKKKVVETVDCCHRKGEIARESITSPTVSTSFKYWAKIEERNGFNE